MECIIKSIGELKALEFSEIKINAFWNTTKEKELKIHRIHAYPAKFPAFITNKALEYARKHSIEPKIIADIFCGCGTVACEAKRNNIDFWGCDINPVATLIAKAKSRNYNIAKLEHYFHKIIENYENQLSNDINYKDANERIKYWYAEKEYINLFKLKRAIKNTIPANSAYNWFFLCAFSNILKITSRWLTKSIKPQIDPYKKTRDVKSAFIEQCKFMIDAYQENEVGDAQTEIVTGNFLSRFRRRPQVDMIITSPPYVTSYEYADLHQLSSLWLGYAEDYRSLREGSVGSLHHVYNFEKEYKKLNETGTKIVTQLFEKDKSKARSVAKYFLDMQKVIAACDSMLNPNGMALFVIGDTEYKGVRIENARHLCESLLSQGFKYITINKRKISGKNLTPYRDKHGRFSSDETSKKIYSEEFIIIGRKL